MKNTYCNPLSIENVVSGKLIDIGNSILDATSECDYRSIADPSVVYYDGKWYMYPSYSLAYVSEDFVHWQKKDIGIEHLRYSPAVVHFKDKWYLSGHNIPEVYVSDNPLGPFKVCGKLTDVHGNNFTALDACYLADGDRLYMYWFSARKPENNENVELVTGTVAAECDPNEPWKLISEPVSINTFSPEKEWERTGEYNQNERMGWTEGQWAIKIKDRYYLLYSGAGTQYSSYATGVLYSDIGPLGPFKRQQNHDPLAEKRHGFVRGAGHGSIAQGPNDTYWLFYTCLYNFAHKFERRIGMDVLGIDEDRELYCSAITETPQFAPGVIVNPEKNNSAGLLPVTSLQPVKASSYVCGREPFYAVDDSVWTWWQPKDDDNEKTLVVELSAHKGYDIEAVRIAWRDVGMDTFNGVYPGPFKYVVEYAEPNSDEWKIVVDASCNETDLCIDYRQFEKVTAKKVRLRVVETPQGIQPGVEGFTVFGKCAH